MRYRWFAVITLAAATFAGIAILDACSSSERKKMTTELTSFIARFEASFRPLSRKAAIASFDASLSGRDEDFTTAADLEVAMSTLLSNKQDFLTLQRIRNAGMIEDPLLKRELDVLYHMYLGKQIDAAKLEDMIRLQKAVEQKFSTYRSMVRGRARTDNEIEDILKTSTNSAELEEAWTASKRVGALVAPDVLRLVRMRNDAARSLGFRNYHAMQLELSEQDPEAIEKLFDELDGLTREAFRALKADIDAYLAPRLGVPVDALRPWHYQNRFFQEAPRIYDVDLDRFYRDKDIVAITRRYFAGIGLGIDTMVAHSDLYERAGKYQHAYCTNIDREGDVRIVCNITPSYNWMNTALHEFGHGVYDYYSDRQVPWILREPAHTFTTEAIAMFFGRLAANPRWMAEAADIPAAETNAVESDLSKSLRLEQLTFSRWAQVMYRFEKAMYENPDQDLNDLWWRLVERYQMIHRPEGRNAPDWASKIHVALYPAYYHNYLLGELLASQIAHHIGTSVLRSHNPGSDSFTGQPNVGAYLQERIFRPGNTMHWSEMIRRATGEELTPAWYARQFVSPR
jgi:peptidyl-dipeptidase A